MHTIHIRNVNDEIYAKLLESCKYSQRSIAREALVLIRDALDANANEQIKRRLILRDMEYFHKQMKLDNP